MRAHRAGATRNRGAIAASTRCGCFHCLATFPPDAITRWVGQDTAICPRCGIDRVVGDASGCPITAELLGRMRAAWF